jgi:hypothetical protein
MRVEDLKTFVTTTNNEKTASQIAVPNSLDGHAHLLKRMNKITCFAAKTGSSHTTAYYG